MLMTYFYRFVLSAILTGLAFLFTPATVHAQDAADSLTFTVFLIGDTGAPTLPGARETLEKMREQLLEAGEKSAVVYL
ncbi:MAG: hypothetical protein WBH03_05905, partial [Cyclobacteriaceae bacterium]